MTYEIQNRHFHHALVEVGGAVFDHLHCNHLLRLEVLTLDNLAERSLAEDVQDQIPVPRQTISHWDRSSSYSK